jgi:hypothetical protein
MRNIPVELVARYEGAARGEMLREVADYPRTASGAVLRHEGIAVTSA